MFFQCPQKVEATASGFSEASPSFLNRMQYPEPHRLAGCKASPASENTRGRVPISETAARSQAFCSAGTAQSKHYLRFVSQQLFREYVRPMLCSRGDSAIVTGPYGDECVV